MEYQPSLCKGHVAAFRSGSSMYLTTTTLHYYTLTSLHHITPHHTTIQYNTTQHNTHIHTRTHTHIHPLTVQCASAAAKGPLQCYICLDCWSARGLAQLLPHASHSTHVYLIRVIPRPRCPPFPMPPFYSTVQQPTAAAEWTTAIQGYARRQTGRTTMLHYTRLHCYGGMQTISSSDLLYV